MQFAQATQCVCMRASFHLHVIHDERLIVRSLSVSSCLSFYCFSPLFTSSLPHSTCTPTCTPSSVSTAPRETTAAPSPNEEYCPVAIYHPPTSRLTTASIFDCSRCGESRFSRFDAHLAPGLTRKVCPTVLFHPDLIGSARISERWRTSRHQPLNVFPTSVDQSAFATLEQLRHSHQLSTRAQSTSL